MESLFSAENLITLALLTLLQAVLGLDNLLYISLESKRAPLEKQRRVRQIGIGGAVILRIVLLFVLLKVIELFQDSLFGIHATGVFEGDFNLHSLIVLFGGVFIMYTAVREIMHMMRLEADDHMEHKPKSVGMIITSIVIMNLVFSFDSILGAIALTDVFWVMATAIIIGGLLMIYMAGRVTEFLKKNRMYEVLGLFILLIVGVMLLSEGGHLAHMKLFGNEITPMTKTTFYFVIAVLVIVDVVQGRYQKKLNRQL
ncbi:MAG: tellurium resistance protein TerC [Bacteroidia bacterium]|nr:tellurium resistance protein TerC [Bacteroidia bacterium]NNF31394.1 tellurium resistance protein TerC [Flavobacteriaceae bacterium]MBT8275939.1 tellurium resistance protein TerC [Bacteroidia bacterium]NNJ81678.1 tellurium resistance protein TerC [Flavobacteriaceae bacterium]NNK53014.1 tellurium resistance protein TerC [Flavobacteriaceae bacterium]